MVVRGSLGDDTALGWQGLILVSCRKRLNVLILSVGSGEPRRVLEQGSYMIKLVARIAMLDEMNQVEWSGEWRERERG